VTHVKTMYLSFLTIYLFLTLGTTSLFAGQYDRMVLIPKGEFVMGGIMGDDDERPEHRVMVKDFFIDRFEVTNNEYAVFLNKMGNRMEGGAHWAFLDSTDCGIEQTDGRFVSKDGYGDRPVVMVTYYGAVAYASWVGKRLPSEAEWEKAARGGLSGQEYPWGDDIGTLFVNYGKKRMGTTPVGMFAPNGFGLYDMAGNVAEMVSDYYSDRYYRDSPATDPTGPVTGEAHVNRGGSWLSDPLGVRVFVREAAPLPYISLPNVGFRCAKDMR
jgi:formylglycine-generating enzyme required for sulfatase activity